MNQSYSFCATFSSKEKHRETKWNIHQADLWKLLYSTCNEQLPLMAMTSQRKLWYSISNEQLTLMGTTSQHTHLSDRHNNLIFFIVDRTRFERMGNGWVEISGAENFVLFTLFLYCNWQNVPQTLLTTLCWIMCSHDRIKMCFYWHILDNKSLIVWRSLSSCQPLLLKKIVWRIC